MTLIVSLVFSLMILIGSVVLLGTRNLVHAAYALALVLVALAGVYVLLQAELMAVVQILLYAGGVVILLIFGVMMSNRGKSSRVESESRNVFLGGLISVAVFVGMAYLFLTNPLEKPSARASSQIEEIGISFLTDHVVAFELIAFILLVALVGASYLAKASSK